MEFGNQSVTGKEATRMRCSHPASFHQQVNFLRSQFLQDDGLPFTNVLTEEGIGQALTAISGWLDRTFSGRSGVWMAW
jgi:hypothetical protein